MEDKLVENISTMAHWLWAHWMKYMISIKTYESDNNNEMIIGWKSTDFERWKRQMLLAYEDLPEEEKESDRVLARQIIMNWTYNPFTGEKL